LTPTKIRRTLSLSQMVDQAAPAMVVAQAVDQEAATHPDLVVALQIHKCNQPIIT